MKGRIKNSVYGFHIKTRKQPIWRYCRFTCIDETEDKCCWQSEKITLWISKNKFWDMFRSNDYSITEFSCISFEEKE